MRQHYERQRRFDCTPIAELTLNFEERAESVAVGMRSTLEGIKAAAEA